MMGSLKLNLLLTNMELWAPSFWMVSFKLTHFLGKYLERRYAGWWSGNYCSSCVQRTTEFLLWQICSTCWKSSGVLWYILMKEDENFAPRPGDAGFIFHVFGFSVCWLLSSLPVAAFNLFPLQSILAKPYEIFVKIDYR